MAMQPVGQPCFVKGQGYTDASSKSPLETSSGQDNSSAQRRANRPAGESLMRANRQKSTEAILRCSVIAGRLSKSRVPGRVGFRVAAGAFGLSAGAALLLSVSLRRIDRRPRPGAGRRQIFGHGARFAWWFAAQTRVGTGGGASGKGV